MTKQEYMNFHETKCREMIEITKRKNADYAGSGNDPFSNFRQIGGLIQKEGVVEIGFLTRMSDKFSRIGSFISNGTLQVKEESVEDTLLDLANYCILFAGYLRSVKPLPPMYEAVAKLSEDARREARREAMARVEADEQRRRHAGGAGGAGPSAEYWNGKAGGAGIGPDEYKATMDSESRMTKPRSDLPSQNGMNIP